MSDEISKFMIRHLPLPLMRDPDLGYWHPLGKKGATVFCMECGHVSHQGEHSKANYVCSACGSKMKEVKS